MQRENTKGNFPEVTLIAPDGAQTKISLYGAHVTSWRAARGEERIFLSKRAEFCEGKAIRGGIPICFPQFAGEGPLIKHGFARLTLWKLISTQVSDNSARAILQLEDSEETRAYWPYSFRAIVTVTLKGPRLLVGFKVENTGDRPFVFSGALHTYLRVDDISQVSIGDLSGTYYRDSVTGKEDVSQFAENLHIAGEVDRIYKQAPEQVTVREGKRCTAVTMTGFQDLVIWNPGPERCAALKDMEPDGYRQMVCVEAAVVDEPVAVAPGESWCGTQELV